MSRFARYRVLRRATRSPLRPSHQREVPSHQEGVPSHALRQYQLQVNPPNDMYEAEADRLAQHVTQMPDEQLQQIVEGQRPATNVAQQVTPLVQRKTADDEEESVQAKLVQRQETMEEDEEESVQTKLIQRQESMEEDEEAVQTKSIQRQEATEEEDDEEAVQTKLIQRQEDLEEEEEEAVQTKLIQRQEGMEEDDEEAVQTKFIQRQENMEEEEEAVQTKLIQRQEGMEEEEAVQTKLIQRQEGTEEDEEEAVQTKPIQRQEDMEDEEETVQTRLGQRREGPEAQAGSASGAGLEERIERQEGGGRPLSAEERNYYEPRFGADFGNVRLHDDAESANVAQALNAQAFTQGEHIYFGAGQYRPGEPAGQELMAHELTHTLQQGAASASTVQERAVQRGTIQRSNGSPAGGGNQPGNTAAPPAPTERVRPQTDPPQLHLGTLPLPTYKYNAHQEKYLAAIHGTPPRLHRSPRFRNEGRSTNQERKWDNNAARASTAGMLEYAGLQPNLSYLIRPKQGTNASGAENRLTEYFGTPAQLTPHLLRPIWNRQGRMAVHTVDHIVELQVSGYPTDKWADDMPNYELLEFSANSTIGGLVSGQVTAAVNAFLNSYRNELPAEDQSKDAAAIMRKYDIYFDGVSDAGSGPARAGLSYWTQQEIEQGSQVRTLVETAAAQRDIEVIDFSNPNPSNPFFAAHNLEDEDVIGSETHLVVYWRAGGFRRAHFRWPDATTAYEPMTARGAARNQIRGFLVDTVHFMPEMDPVAELTGYPWRGHSLARARRSGTISTQQHTVRVSLQPGVGRSNQPIRYAGYIGDNEWSGIQAEINGLSPLNLADVYLDEQAGLTARGQILPTVPLLERAGIDIVLQGEEIQAQKVFSPGEFNVPGPIAITNSDLMVSLGTQSGLGVDGRLDFQIERVGQGNLTGRAQTGRPGGGEAGFELGGEFNFDSELFDPATIRMWYRDNQVGGQGILRIPSGKLRGIRSAQFDVSYAGERLEASGTAQFEAPGIRQAGLNLTYSEQEGITIGGSLQLGEVPGLSGGSLDAEVQQKPDGAYKVRATGTAQPAIPGISSRVTIAYDDGLFDANVTAAYQRGMLSGELTLGATNRPVGDDNRPAGEPGNQVRAYGGGQVTVQIAPWLQGTVGIRLLPNAEIELLGQIALPNTVDIFPRKAIERNIFTINVDIPIVGVAVAGQRIGIFCTIGGGLDVSAGIGPGQIQELGLGIRYNPDREEETHVFGSGRLHIPADAGLRLFVRGGVGAGIPIVSATAGLEVSGELGIEGAIGAAVNVDWTPQTGLEIRANANIFAEPVLRLSVDAYVDVSADLLFTEVDLYNERWNLAGIEYGSGLRFGIAFPIHYLEGQPFDISLDDVQFTVPSLDARRVIGSVLA